MRLVRTRWREERAYLVTFRSGSIIRSKRNVYIMTSDNRNGKRRGNKLLARGYRGKGVNKPQQDGRRKPV